MQVTKKGYEFVAEELRRRIESKLLQAGDKLPTIEQLAKQFFVGRSTIREALSLLRAEGLIESIQGGGTFVSIKPIDRLQQASQQWLASQQELNELLQVRKILEVGTISLAAGNRTNDDIEELRQIIDGMRNSIGNEDMSQLHDVHFHLAIARSTHNTLLQNMMESLSSAMTRTMRNSRKLWLYSEFDSASHLFDEHEQMFLAIVQQNGDSAAATMKHHLERVEEAFGVIRG